MKNSLGRKYEKGMTLSTYEYKNFGVSLTSSDKMKALSEWVYLNKNIKS